MTAYGLPGPETATGSAQWGREGFYYGKIFKYGKGRTETKNNRESD